MKFELSEQRRILLICLLISFFLLLIGVLSGIPGVLGNTIILSVFIIMTPQLILSYISYRTIKEIELRFPHFLRDLVESTRAGMPLHKAIIFASHTDYGPLSPYVKGMANQLSWNVNILKVLEQAKEKLKKSKTLSRVFRIMMETYKSGGSIDNILDSLSSTMLTVQDTEKERKSTLSQYVIAMYVISIVFLGIIVGINWLMVPVFQAMITPVGGVSPMQQAIANPCVACLSGVGIACGPCNIYFSICSFFGSEKGSIACYYLAIFFSISLIQALMGGLVAGEIGEGSVKAGIKHSLILVFMTVGAFFIFVHTGLLGG